MSVGLPVYNGVAPERLPRALDSLLALAYSNIEIVISDDASTDGTEKICREYAARDSRIRYIRQPINTQLIPNTQFVIEESRGEYFMLAGDDDWWDPNFIDKPKWILDTHQSYGAALNSVRRIYGDGSTAHETCFTGAHNATHKGYAEVFEMMHGRSKLFYFAGLYRTKLLHDLLRQPFPTCIRYDRVFACELAFATHIYTLPDMLYHKTVYKVSTMVRYVKTGIIGPYLDPKSHSKYVWAIISRLVRSRSIPLTRKLTLYPWYFLRLLWYHRKFVREWSPKLYSLAHHVLKPLRYIKRAWSPVV